MARALLDRWKGLKKNQGQQTHMYRTNKEKFKTNIGNLFDVAHADALKLLKNLEDHDFLLAQWELGWRRSMGSVDLVLAQKEDAAQKKEAEARRIERMRMEQEASCSQVELASSSSVSDSEGSVAEEEGEVRGDASPLRRKWTQVQNVWIPDLTAALDCTKMSDRMAPHILTEVLP